MKKSDLQSAYAQFSEAEAAAKRSKADVEASEKAAASAFVNAYDMLMRTRYMVKGLAGWNIDTGLDFGFGLGLIFRDTILLEVDVTKTNGFKDWKEKGDYTVRAGIGIVF